MYFEVATMVAVLILLIVNSVACLDQPTSIKRRAFGDIVYHNQESDHFTCNKTTVTYDIATAKCRLNEDYFAECSFALTPSGEPQLKRMILAIRSDKKTLTFDSNDAVTTALTVSTSDNSYANGTFCQINTLEVHRGWNLTTQIDHRGLYLSENAVIEVHMDNLAYGFDNYEGELYRMNLSCSREGHSERGCLFFKVYGETNLASPKFNCTVPGTLYNKSDDCPDTVTNAPHSIHSNKEPPITANPQATFSDTKDKTATEMIADSTTSQSRNSSRKTLILATGLGGVISVILVLLCLCVCVCCVLICRRQRMKVSAITSAEMERRISTVSKQVEAANGKVSHADLELHVYESPGEILRSNAFGCNCLEDNPAYQKPVSKSEEANKMLECNYAIIPEFHSTEPIYQEIPPKLKTQAPRRRSRSGTHAVIFVDNPLYEHSKSLPPPHKDKSNDKHTQF